MKPVLLIVHRESDGSITPMKFAYESGEMSVIVEEVAEYIAGMGLVDSLWEGVAADRLRTILNQNVKIQEMANVINQLQESYGLEEAAG